MYQYPYGNAQQLNLDWILGKIQELEAGSGGGADLEEVANALVSASFDAGVSYRRYDYCFYNGKLYRALNDTSGAFNPADWLEVVIGDDIPVLTRLLNAVDTSLTSLQNTVNDLDSDDVDNASLVVSGTTVTDALETLNTAITNLQTDVGDLDSDDVDNASNVTGATVSAALDTLSGAITNVENDVSDLDTASDALQNQICLNIEETTTASRAYNVGEYLILNGILYKVISNISSGAIITPNTNVVATTATQETTAKAESYTLSQCTSYGVGPEYRSYGAVKYFFFFAKITDITQDAGTHWILVATLDNTSRNTRGLIWNTTKSLPVPIRKEINGIFLEPSNVAVNDVLYGEIVWID